MRLNKFHLFHKKENAKIKKLRLEIEDLKQKNLDSYLEYQKRIAIRDDDIIRLNYKITELEHSLRTESSRYEEKISILEKIISIYSMDKEELLKQKNNFFSPYLNTETGEWEVPTAICSLGGCEYRCFSGETELEVLRKSVVATLKGQTVECGCACPECYAEYMRKCN